MRIVFKPLGLATLVIAMTLILVIALWQRFQLQKARQDLAHVQTTPKDKDALTDGVYKIEAKHSHFVLGTRNASTDPNAEGHITQGPFKNAPNQKWRLMRLPDGAYNIQNTQSGFWLDNVNASRESGDYVRQWFPVDRTTNGAQQWLLIKQGDNAYQIRGVTSGKVIEVHAASKEAGSLVYQEEWNGQNEQKFVLTRLGD